jgi:phospholipid transport system substrate-binding protein
VVKKRVEKTGIPAGMAVLLAALMVLIVPLGEASEGPMESIRTTTERILEVLNDPDLKGPEKIEERRNLVREAAEKRLDWGEIARRSLGRHWRSISGAEREEFQKLLRDLAEGTLLGRLGEYSGEKVIYDSERIDGKYSEVKIKIITEKSQEIPVVYRMKESNGCWRVYDVLIEGVSLVNNYRSQFNEILVNGSYQDLVERLKDRLRELREEDAGKES